MATELAKSGAGELAVVESGNPILDLLKATTASGITPESAAVVKELVGVFREVEADRAKKEFAAAFAGMQADMPRVIATKDVPNNDGTVRYAYAPYEDLMAKVGPVLSRHGFSVCFDMDFQENRIVAKCTLTHRGGHSRTNQFAARAGKGPPGTNDAQADGSARTYARRLALCDALNIVVEKDSDARSEGEVISSEEATALEKAVRAIVGEGDGMPRWLRLAGADRWEDVRAAKAEVVWAAVEKAQSKASAPACPATAEAWMTGVECRFLEVGKTSNDMSKWLKGVCEKRGASSYLTLTPEQRSELWLLLHKAK